MRKMASATQLNHLLKWLKTFSVSLPCGSAQQISDGVALAHIAHQIDPIWFDDAFLAKIKPDVGTNKIIKESNLKKVLEKLLDFYRDRLDQRLSGFVTPDVSKIADHNDETELCRVLQLLLGCAIHSDRKDEFIPAIMGMEEDVQQAIMRAIQELLAAGDSWDSATDSMFASVGMATGRAVPPPAESFELRKMATDLEAANEDRQLLSRKCDQLVSQVALLHDENQRLQREIEKLRKADTDKENAEEKDKESGSSEGRLRRQIETLREKIHALETSRDECKGRSEELERDLEDLQKRFEQSQNEAAECKRLKDEVDILRECAARAARAENTVESLRRKAEEVTKLKHDLRILEDKNAEYIQKNIDLEEELKKLGPWKTQLEVQRKQLAELQTNLTEETKRADRFEFEKNKLKEKFDTLTKEKERLLAERDSLREANEELRFAQLNSSPKTGANTGFDASVDGLDMIPHEIKEKMLRLEHENRVLRQKEDQRSEAQSERALVYQPVIDGLQERIQQLETENRSDRQRVLLKQASLDSVPVRRLPLLSKPVFAGPLLKNRSHSLTNGEHIENLTVSNNAQGEVGKVKGEFDRVQKGKGEIEAARGEFSNLGASRKLKEEFKSKGDRESSVGEFFKWGDRSKGSRGELKKSAPVVKPKPIQSRVARLREAFLFPDRAAAKVEIPPPLVAPPPVAPPPPIDAVVITKNTASTTSSLGSLHTVDDVVDRPYNREQQILESEFYRSHPRTSSPAHQSEKRGSLYKSDYPDDVIEVDHGFPDGGGGGAILPRGSIDSEVISLSSISIISEPISKFSERSDSVMLTPRSYAESERPSSRMSLRRLASKKKVFKTAATAMFSLLGP